MSNTLTLDIIRQLPKAELHCHLDGFCRPETIMELASEQGIDLEVSGIDQLKSLMTAPMDCPDLVTYLKCFDITLKVMQEPYAITRIFYEACEDAVKDGIFYLELRFAPALHTQHGHSYSQILEAAIQGCMMAMERLDITARIICCAMRHHDPDVNSEIAEICWRYRHRYVVGFDLAGPEHGFPPQKHVNAFRTARQKSLSVTIHAGEAFGAKSVELALQCSAQRIGHGTRVVEDENVLNEVIDRRVTLECCVSSNVQTKAVEKLEDHPIKKLFDLGVRTVPCTDNPTVSGVTLSGEYFLLHTKFGFSVADIMKMIDFGFRGAFVSEGMKKRLRVEAIVRAMKVLQANNIDVSGMEEKYYANLGVTVPPKFLPPVENPPLTLALLQQMPKCDLDCRLVGSVPMTLMFKYYTELSETQKKKFPVFKDVEELAKFCVNDEKHKEAKKLCQELLQTERNIRDATRAVIYEAYVDKVVYMELSLCPLVHTKKGLTPSQVVSAVLDEIQKFTAGKEMEVNVVLNANVQVLNPLDVQKVAELCVEYKGKGVVGFATTTMEIGVSNMRFYEPTFEYLRANFVPVTIFAGEENSESVPCALVRGYARRISGGFKIAQSESLLNDVTSHNTTILISLSRRMERSVTGWSKSPVRFFFDFGVRVAFCSLYHSFKNITRSQQLFELAEQSGFDALSVMTIIDNTFASMFVPYKKANNYQKMFWERSIAILKDNGFTRTMNYTYFVPK